jgi:hypothetical protein
VTRAQGMREADIRGWVTEALQNLRMRPAAAELTKQQEDNARTNRWLRGPADQLPWRSSGRREGARVKFVTTAVRRRWFQEMMALVNPVPWRFRFGA